MRLREGDIVAYPDTDHHPYRVIRVEEDDRGNQVVVLRDPDTGATFKALGHQLTLGVNWGIGGVG